MYPYFAYYGDLIADGDYTPSGPLPTVYAEYETFVGGTPAGLWSFEFPPPSPDVFQRSFAFDPCLRDGSGSDLPGTTVLVKAGVVTEAGRRTTEEVTIPLGNDTLAPRVRVVSRPARGTRMKAGDQIVLTVTANEARGSGPWQMGVERIQVLGPAGLVASEDYQEYRAKPCDLKSWTQTFEATYTVPKNPPAVIELCAWGEDFAGNRLSHCGTFYTGEVWQGTMHSDANMVNEVPENPCYEKWDTMLTLIVDADGVVSGEGHATASMPTTCVHQPDLPPMTAVTFQVDGIKNDDRFEIRLTPTSISGQLCGGFCANWIGPGGVDPAIQIVFLSGPASAASEVTLIDASDYDAGTTVNTYRLICETCTE